MYKDLTAASWKTTMDKIRQCHLSLIGETKEGIEDWHNAFEALTASIREERKAYPEFSPELAQLTEATGSNYDFTDIFEEYFDHLEQNNAWETVIASCDEILSLFKWRDKLPSEFMYRKGRALEKLAKFEEAKAFGEKWLKDYPEDLYAVASNVFLMIEMKDIEGADRLTKKYLKEDMVCSKSSDTFLMAAYRLCEITKNINAKQRIEEKIAEYEKLAGELKLN